ncbi:hypothetical protein H2204_010866 [Knufia peltigerae]|uniref:Tyrosinase copper-binding domain-containing protein n=1 Tax=Knufia peltigerae TaxID=1002370 RepID=A0AA38XVF3_9EURO|nr:hypothetical protein H2204_010866 [Knufia peltigerae]
MAILPVSPGISSERSSSSSNDDALDEEKVQKENFRWHRSGRASKTGEWVTIFVLIVVLIMSAMVFVTSDWLHRRSIHVPDNNNTLCRKNLRRNWVELSVDEKHQYIDAVSCLRRKPSRFNSTNMSLYDDFPRIHARVGSYAHQSAPFFAWHRYLIHLYEKTLREECEYEGNLVYWDWTQDWEKPSASSVVTGVANGQFAGLQVHSFGPVDESHCLSRGFWDRVDFDVLGKFLDPERVSKILMLDDYEAFLLALESSAHNAIPQGVGGDFAFHAAPYDPVFFLHHTQVDRLWWTWQQRHPNKKYEYNGANLRGSSIPATLDDVLVTGGFADDVKVREVMSTDGPMMCYGY